jgi:hypothetical protein
VSEEQVRGYVGPKGDKLPRPAAPPYRPARTYCGPLAWILERFNDPGHPDWAALFAGASRAPDRLPTPSPTWWGTIEDRRTEAR